MGVDFFSKSRFHNALNNITIQLYDCLFSKKEVQDSKTLTYYKLVVCHKLYNVVYNLCAPYKWGMVGLEKNYACQIHGLMEQMLGSFHGVWGETHPPRIYGLRYISIGTHNIGSR